MVKSASRSFTVMVRAAYPPARRARAVRPDSRSNSRRITSGDRKSVGAEETFAADIGDPQLIRRELLRLSGRTAHALRAGGYAARTITVKLRLADFTTITRSRTLPDPTDVANQIYATACALHEGSGLSSRARLRLVGVRATGLVPAASAVLQLTLGERPESWREAERAVDRIARRFGAGAVRPAALVEGDQAKSGNPADSATPETPLARPARGTGEGGG